MYTKVELETWKPETEGDCIEGSFIDKEEISFGDEKKSILYHIDVSDRIVGVWGTTVLDTKMTAVKPKDKIKIEFLGLGVAKPGRKAPKLFEVYIDYDLRVAMEYPASEPTEPMQTNMTPVQVQKPVSKTFRSFK